MDKHSLALLQLQKHLPDFELVDFKNKLFKSDYLLKHFHCRKENGVIYGDSSKHTTDWTIELQRILIKCCRDNNCYPSYAYKDNLFKLNTFTLRETDEQFEYLIHSSNVHPNIILKEGLKIRYSLSYSKGFPPLIFLSSSNRTWIGKYQYKVKIHQKLYFDTNLNHQCRKGNDWFCVLQNIRPEDIALIQ